LRAWAVRHLQSFFYSLGLMARAPGSSLMTAGVLGIALALPGGVYLVLENVTGMTGQWDARNQISIFLADDMGDEAAGQFAVRLAKWPEIARIEVTSRADALAEYRRMSGFENILDAFEGANPLPAVLSVEPAVRYQEPAPVEALAASLERLPEVNMARFDLRWLRRLEGIFEIVRRGVYLLATLLALGVVLVVSNTVRLGIESRREEVEIARLFGATDAFIRRPFLYGGLLFGFSGGCLAWIILAAGFGVLAPSVARLVALYDSSYRLAGLDVRVTLILLGGGAVLGLLGAWITLGRHLQAVEPG
jgi:cell division transport system permease protein